MSYSGQREKYAGLGPTGGISMQEIAFLKHEAKASSQDNLAVDRLIDQLRKILGEFRFKEPLGESFEIAKEAALNCLENSDPPPRRIRHWIGDYLKCADCILLMYIQDVLDKNIPKENNAKWPKEQDVYKAYLSLQDVELRRVGAIHSRIYLLRSRLEHIQIVKEDNRRSIQRQSHKNLKEQFTSAHTNIKDALDVMVPRYRKAYPQHCTDRI